MVTIAINVNWDDLTKPGGKLKYIAPGPKVWTGGVMKRKAMVLKA